MMMRPAFYQTMQGRFGAVLLMLLALGQPLAAQDRPSEAAGPGQQGETLIRSAYAKTKTAQTLQQYTEVIELCEQALSTPLSAENSAYVKKLLSWAHNRRGEAYADQAAARSQGEGQQPAELDALALADFEMAIQHDPDRWKAIHNRGVSYALERRYEEAVADFSRVLQLKPDYANAWFNRGEIHYELGQFDKAIRDYTQTIRLNPEDPGAPTSRAHAYFQTGRFREALRDYHQAVRLTPDSAEAHVNRADAYHSLGQWEQAARDYRQALRLDDQFGRAYQGAAWLMATCPDSRFRNPEMALRAAQRAIELDGRDDFRYLDTLAASHANAGQFAEAQAVLDQALEIAPPEQTAMLEERLQLYAQEQPFRQ